MGLVILPKVASKLEIGWAGVEPGGGIENVTEYRLSRDLIKPFNTAGNCISAIPKFIFFMVKGGPPDSSPNLRVQRSCKAFGKSRFS